jgi:hypothetical protein
MLFVYLIYLGVGWCPVFLCLILATYQNTLMTWILYYLYSSFHGVLPWTTCDNAWNTGDCISRLDNTTNSTEEIQLTKNLSAPVSIYQFLNESGTSVKAVSPPEEFWQYVSRVGKNASNFYFSKNMTLYIVHTCRCILLLKG